MLMGSIGNPPGFAGPPLLSWQEIRLRVHYSTLYEPAPLLDRITITGVVADLRRDREGRDNFSDIGPIEPSSPSAAALAMPVIELRDASFRYTDEAQTTAPLAVLDGANLTLEKISRGAGVSEGAHWEVGALSLTANAKMTQPSLAGPLNVRVRDLDARIPEDADMSIDVANVELGFDALRAKTDALAFRPPAIAAAVGLEPIVLDQLLRVTGVEPPFRSTADLLQVRELVMQARFDGKLLRLDELVVNIDESRIRGDVLLDDPVRLALEIDRLDLEKYTAALGGETDDDPEAPLAFPGKLLQDFYR
ncbi:MAG: hypothetical protein FJ179_11460 [Gammaproteobacteria bacterium]|nr:hypothetical protein [Gammaproteobacteria bacterium]